VAFGWSSICMDEDRHIQETSSTRLDEDSFGQKASSTQVDDWPQATPARILFAGRWAD